MSAWRRSASRRVLFVCPERIGENDEIRRDCVIRCERNLRMPIYWVLDEKATVASCLDMRQSLVALIDEIGLDYWKRVSRELIEEGRVIQLARTRQLTVLGRYHGHTFYGHPDNKMVVTATSWALLPAYGVFQRLLSRGFLARVYVQEVFVGQMNNPMIEMGGESQYGTPFGMAHFECAAAGSGALKDGLDTAYVGGNPEPDIGNIEIWDQNMPMIYIGRSILPNSGGYGKYRGGCPFIPT